MTIKPWFSKLTLYLNQPWELVIRFPDLTWFLFHMASIFFFIASVFLLLGLKACLWRLRFYILSNQYLLKGVSHLSIPYSSTVQQNSNTTYVILYFLIASFKR